MLERIINFSIKNKLIIILFTLSVVVFGLFAVYHIPVGSVPDITNNQVQVITTSQNLSTQEIEQYITAPVEMEMANLPGVTEIRSISKFGISLVTVVFEENLGTYLPRQLISEKIKTATENIPEGYGTPEMGPISTGLGEIYQYILDIEPGYEDQYTPMDLRTIQDWIVRRRLSGINGVVEVNSWGGFLKQYEVAIDPSVLKSMNISLLEVYHALETNNNITGAAYIEKTNQSYFIRGDGQIKSLDDIKNIWVKNNQGVPVYIKDIAEIQYGYANRFGAITANGKGETILGQVMMLKNANSKEVIEEVNKRIAETQKSLPEGVFINPILERGELIKKTSHTIVENLIFGALIVFGVVLLLLGNLRSALIIASIIPLALLFTISMMYIFGIDANLMSLGALDFGIIIDGAVIIAEFILLRMNQKSLEIDGASKDKKQALKDSIAAKGAAKMMKSAIFGQVIILIVFIPILSLRGVEGKMFHPMALAFSFAIIGAMIMGLTWLPVATSLFLKPSSINKKNISYHVMQLAYNTYTPVMRWSCHHKRLVLGMAIAALILTGVIFSRIGAEFVPTLDEGDFVIQPVLKTGTSLTKTIEMTTRMEKILIDSFPNEVHQIVSRIGAAEVPTDPMSMEEVDVIIKLHSKEQWKVAKSKDELGVKFKEALSVIPGPEYEFTQPIEMRFNELITGVRSDIAIKIYGDDLDYLDTKAGEIKGLVENVPGASDVIVEKTSGLPQIKLDYHRNKIAYYGVDISTLNNYLSAAFGGMVAGTIFEGEKRFDLVVRFNQNNRADIENIETLMVPVSNGGEVPLSELAEISYTKGPAKISRDNAQRRVVVSVNVLNRDLQSVVADIQQIIDNNLKLQPGYYVSYGGQFENLQNASRRLLVAVPVSLLLIFIFLHFAFQSLKDAIMIFTAIPLATVGGVMLLWIRGMPFSVSAGVGFIALFGIAVLNGIVLIEHLKELQSEGFKSTREMILTGTKNRLRAVMLTAGAAAMGFLPMAISTGAGAEVQRPLATVVIGGLVTSTMLTMIALPLLFEIFYNVTGIKFFPLRFIRSKKAMGILLLLVIPLGITRAQNKALTLNEVVNKALENNQLIKAWQLKTDEAEMLTKTAFSPDKTTVYYGADENNIAENNHPLKVWGIQQGFHFPTQYTSQKQLLKTGVQITNIEHNLHKEQFLKQLSESYCQLQALQKQEQLFVLMDSLYTSLYTKMEKRAQVNDISQIELLNLKTKLNAIELEFEQLEKRIETERLKLQQWAGLPNNFQIRDSLQILPQLGTTDSLTILKWYGLREQYAQKQVKVEQSKLLPDFSVEYYIGSNAYENAQNYQGFEVGIGVPLFFGSQNAKIKAARLNKESESLLAAHNHQQIKLKIQELQVQQQKHLGVINNFQELGSDLINEIIRSTDKSYQLQGISFITLVNNYQMVLELKQNYINAVLQYNMATLELTYLSH